MTQFTNPNIPDSLRDTWGALCNEVAILHLYWIIYRQLFAKSEERVNLLNECASTFFYVIQNILIDDVQLKLSKLADPAQTGDRRNATLKHVINEIGGSQSLTDNFTNLLGEYKKACRRIIDRRNKQIAHHDLTTFLERYREGDPNGLSRQEIEDALEALGQLMEPLEAHLTSTTTAYRHFQSRHDGNDLIAILKRGLRYQDLQNEGKIPRDDLGTSNRAGA